MYIIDYVLPRVSRFAFTRSTLQREWLKGNPAYAISVSFVPRFRPVVFFPPTIFFHHLGSLAALSISIIKGGSRRAAFRVKSIEAVRLALIEIKSDTANRNMSDTRAGCYRKLTAIDTKLDRYSAMVSTRSTAARIESYRGTATMPGNFSPLMPFYALLSDFLSCFAFYLRDTVL